MEYLENIKKPFQFNGKTLTFDLIKEWVKVKVYKESSHLDRILVKDTDGNLYLYEFYEKMNFDKGDEIFNTYAVVSSEEDADNLNKEAFIRRKNCFWFDNTGKVHVI